MPARSLVNAIFGPARSPEARTSAATCFARPMWKAAYSFHPEGSDEAIAWVRERALRILRGEVSQVVKGMTQSATKHGLKGQKRKAIDDERRRHRIGRAGSCHP